MNRAVIGRSLAAALAAGAWVMPACSSDPDRAGMATASGGGGATSQGGATSKGGVTGNSGGRAGGVATSGGASGSDAGGSSSDAGGPGTGGGAQGGAESSGGNAGEGGSDPGGGGEGGSLPDPYRCPSDDADLPSPALVSLCSPEMAWGEGRLAPIDAGDGDQLIGVTPDELTIVWFDASGAAGAYKLADRAASDGAFSAPTVLAAGTVIGVSPDGLRLTSLSFDQSVLVEYVRTARGASFDAGGEGAFAELNADALAQGYRVLDALIAPDDETLYYNVSGSEELGSSFHVSRRSGSRPWPVGTPIEDCELKSFGSLLRHPTGASADGLTLFFYDAARGVSRAGFRRTVSGPFVWFVDLGQRYQATPNQSCDKLYYSASDERTSLFVATAE